MIFYGFDLRCYQEWLRRATKWENFSATASLGVIHKGHLQQGCSLMAPYLHYNAASGGGTPFFEVGALYALGLIHKNNGEGIKPFLRESLRSANLVVSHSFENALFYNKKVDLPYFSNLFFSEGSHYICVL